MPLQAKFRLFSYLNIDVVLGALGTSYLFQIAFLGRSLSLYYWVALGAAVYAVYVIDRLGDVKSIGPGRISSNRHWFYFTHFNSVSYSLLVCIVLGGWAAFQLPIKLWVFGLLCGGCSAIYLLLVHYYSYKKQIWAGKEFFIALLWTLGTWYPISLYPKEQLPVSFYGEGLVLFMLACSNLLIFSLIEAREDEIHKQPSFVNTFGIFITLLLIEFLVVGGGLLAVLLAVWNPDAGVITTSITQLIMFSILYVVYRKRNSALVISNYRWMADGVFLLGFPAAIMLQLAL